MSKPAPPPAKEKGCMGCVHFFITHDRQRPYGCRKFNFKGPFMPVLTVRQSSGTDCAYRKLNRSNR
ncbi:MAG: hypothetical protein CNE91_07195 [SAR116 cluster bacterium MED-G04]|nr:hypothetical protein [SAR116 cluster bacterium]OUW37128.1 MAG: hypothetical protein CBD43_02400 [Gammaproteobacteria bacterium TMED183]PDH62541.1 MAG: hypothetical protein CNE91_07195 [SAR116 cluster bacterium MED-G04]HCD50164.1 hypothetical protein [Alphaproteobacteria bacterium]HCV63113.1 hypothetical protein [Alphaproteobacteria bacterium]